MIFKVVIFLGLLMIPILILVKKWIIYLEDMELAERIMKEQEENKEKERNHATDCKRRDQTPDV